jgi:hypothetical protein
MDTYPSQIGSDEKKFKSHTKIADKVFVQKTASADRIYSFCIQAIETIELTTDDWRVTYS